MGLTSLYLLAAPSTPELARKEIAGRIGLGETPTCAEVEDTIKRAKQKKNGAARNITNSNDAEDADASAAARKAKYADVDQDAESAHEQHDPQHGGDDPAPAAGATSKSRIKSLVEVWDAALPEQREPLRELILTTFFVDANVSEIIDYVPAAKRAEMRDRVVSRQIAAASQSSNLAVSLTGLLRRMLSTDGAEAEVARERMKTKLVKNKRSTNDICVGLASAKI